MENRDLPAKVENHISRKEYKLRTLQEVRGYAQEIGVALDEQQKRKLEKQGKDPYEIFVQSDRGERYRLTKIILGYLTIPMVGEILEEVPMNLQYKILGYESPEDLGGYLKETDDELKAWYYAVNEAYERAEARNGGNFALN